MTLAHKVPRQMFAVCVSLHRVATNIKYDGGLEGRFKFNRGMGRCQVLFEKPHLVCSYISSKDQYPVAI